MISKISFPEIQLCPKMDRNSSKKTDNFSKKFRVNIY